MIHSLDSVEHKVTVLANGQESLFRCTQQRFSTSGAQHRPVGGAANQVPQSSTRILLHRLSARVMPHCAQDRRHTARCRDSETSPRTRQNRSIVRIKSAHTIASKSRQSIKSWQSTNRELSNDSITRYNGLSLLFHSSVNQVGSLKSRL